MDTDRPVPSTTARRAGGWRALLPRYALGLTAVGAVVFFFVRERDLFAGVGADVTHLNWYWVVAAFAAGLASVPPLAEAQRMVLGVGGIESGRLRMNLVTLSEGYSFVRYRRFGAGTAVAAWSELAVGAIAFCALAALALPGAVIAGGGAEPILLPLLAVVFAGSAGAAMLFRYPRLLVRGLDWIGTQLGPAGGMLSRLTRGVCQTAGSLAQVRPSMGVWTAAWGLSVLNWLLDAVCLALSFAAVYTAIPWGAVLLAFAGAKVVGGIGLTPGGLGIVEGGLVATFIAYGVAGASAVAAVLVYRAVSLVGLVGIGWLAVALLAVEDGPLGRKPG
jgi:uncharacterized membrane protein YbhN (UPF0104 family)